MPDGDPWREVGTWGKRDHSHFIRYTVEPRNPWNVLISEVSLFQGVLNEGSNHTL